MKIITALLITIYLFASNFAFAGDASGKVKHIMVHTGDVVMFSVGTHNNKPACSTVADDWVLSLKTEKGKAMYSMLLSAAAQGKTVNIIGENACNGWGDRESPLYMYVSY